MPSSRDKGNHGMDSIIHYSHVPSVSLLVPRALVMCPIFVLHPPPKAERTDAAEHKLLGALSLSTSIMARF